MSAPTILDILSRIILPIFILIGVGVLVDRKVRVDLPTLSRLCFRVLLPALIVVKLMESEIALDQMRLLVLATVVHMTAMLGLAWVVFWRVRSRASQLVLDMGAVLANCGNFGIPLAELAFPGHGTGVMAVLLMVQNLLTFSAGIYLIERFRAGSPRHEAGITRSILRMPVLHAVILGTLLRVADLPLPTQLDGPLHYVADALIPLALLTLGVQLSRCRLAAGLAPLAGVTVVRLIASPLMALGIVQLLCVPQPYAAIFVVAAGLPVAVNVYILAAEYELDGALASQAILWTTLSSAATLSVLLAFTA